MSAFNILFLVGFLLFPFFVFAVDIESFKKRCAHIFGSKLYYESLMLHEDGGRSREFHPLFVDPKQEMQLSRSWNERPDTPELLTTVLPEGVSFIKYQQYQPETLTAVKLEAPGVVSVVMARAGYKYAGYDLHTNVAFSNRALWSNMSTEKNWLVGEDAKAAILHLHGGGTKSTGAHVGGTMISHFKDMDVDVVSVDLPWHAQGPREFMNIESDVRALSAFAKKYIPPHVPVFVSGHSWGSVFAEQLMMMTALPRSQFSFHKNLRGVIILSTAVIGPVAGKTLQERNKEYQERRERVNFTMQDQVAEVEAHLWKSIIADGKWSPMGGMYSTATILQLDQTLPYHRGKNYIPALVVVGKYDPLVYVGFEDLYNYYGHLENVDFRLLDRLPYYKDKKKPDAPFKRVGHIIGDFLTEDKTENVQYALMREFIQSRLQSSVLHSTQRRVSMVVKRSDMSQRDKEALTRDLRGIDSLHEMSEFMNTDPRIQLLDSAVMDAVRADVVVQHSRATINVDKENKRKGSEAIPAFIRLVQEFANNLAFRYFIQDYVYYKEEKTADHTEISNKQNDITNGIVGHLSPYRGPQKRVAWFIDRVSRLSTSPPARLNELKQEIEYLTSDGFLQVLSNNKMQEMLLQLRDMFDRVNPELWNMVIEEASLRDGESGEIMGDNMRKSLTEQQRMIDEAFSDIIHTVDQIKEEPYIKSEMSNIVMKKVSKGRMKGLLGEIINAESIDQVTDIMSRHRIPEDIKAQVAALFEAYLVNKQVLEGKYIPDMQALNEMRVQSQSELSLERGETEHQILRSLNEMGIPIASTADTSSRRMNGEELTNIRNELQEQYEALSDSISDSQRESIQAEMRKIDHLIRVANQRKRVFDQNRILQDIIAERRELESTRSELTAREKELKRKHESVLQSIRKHISVIKKALEEISQEPPASLITEFGNLRREFDEKVVPAELEMERVLDEISAIVFENKSNISSQEAIRVLQDSRGLIDRFGEVFFNYVQKRDALNLQAIEAMEAGEKGRELQTSVIALYGRSSRGRRPLLGSESIYLEMEKLIEELARVESQLLENDRLLLENRMRYNVSLNSIRNLVVEESDPEMYDLMQTVAHLSDTTEIAISDIINYSGPKERQIERIQEERRVFEKAMNKWRSMKSSHPPFLPTSQ